MKNNFGGYSLFWNMNREDTLVDEAVAEERDILMAGEYNPELPKNKDEAVAEGCDDAVRYWEDRALAAAELIVERREEQRKSRLEEAKCRQEDMRRDEEKMRRHFRGVANVSSPV